MLVLFVAALLASSGRAQEANPAAGDLVALYPDLLPHRGLPETSEDWSFLPFADRGAWFGFALPPTERADLRGGFVGPFLMADGRWLGPQVARLTLAEVGDGRPIRFDETDSARSDAYPGSLEQELSADGLEIRVTLWFDSSRTAFVRAEIRNSGSRHRNLVVGWSGSIFTDVARLAESAGTLTVHSRTVTRATLRLTPNGPSARNVLGESSYAIREVRVVDLAPGTSVTTTLGLTLTLGDDEPPADSDIAATLDDPRASLAEARRRWQHYLDAVGARGDSQDAVSILKVKAVQTLLTNWRAPAGRFAHDSLFPSSNVGYFNGFWAWDSWKHAVGLVRFAPELAKEQVRAMFDHQDQTGMIADVVYLDPAEDNWRDTKPPLAGWAIQEIYDATGDRDFVAELYP